VRGAAEDRPASHGALRKSLGNALERSSVTRVGVLRPLRIGEVEDAAPVPQEVGPGELLAAIHPPDTAGAILVECLGLPARPPLVAPARRVAPVLFDPDTDWSRD